MHLSVDDRNGIGIVRVADDITMENIEDFREFFHEEVNPHFTKVILDMSDVDYFCSSAYGVMIRCLEVMRGKGGDMVLANCCESVHRLFEVTRLTAVIRIEENEDQAIHYFEKHVP